MVAPLRPPTKDQVPSQSEADFTLQTPTYCTPDTQAIPAPQSVDLTVVVQVWSQHIHRLPVLLVRFFSYYCTSLPPHDLHNHRKLVVHKNSSLYPDAVAVAVAGSRTD
ncbi:hypothetical protein PG993_014572 [Apiospora rasikravindrae]|uniref:Uncharacterized protein n=1 Tax=Apiospora rasikravindrae TaxID=990691 RepID=A0ABR1RQ57_9PEZI